MTQITIAVDGPEADLALADLLAVPGIQSNIQSAEKGEVTKDGGILLAIGAIVGIASGIAEIVAKIIAWREKWKAADAAKQLNVVVQDAKGNRLSLEKATPQEIISALQSIAR